MTAPDPQGQAALLLVEALIHLLVEKGILEKNEVCRAIEGVEEIKGEMAADEPASSWRPSLTMLRIIRESLEVQ